jgi:hypothetical protein
MLAMAMTEAQLRAILARNKSITIDERNSTWHKDKDLAGLLAADPQPHPVCALAKDPAPQVRGLARPVVRITFHRVRSLDRENDWSKPITDGLVKAGLLPGDSRAEIDLEVTEKKIEKG